MVMLLCEFDDYNNIRTVSHTYRNLIDFDKSVKDYHQLSIQSMFEQPLDFTKRDCSLDKAVIFPSHQQ